MLYNQYIILRRQRNSSMATNYEKLIEQINNGELDERFAAVYGRDGLEAGKRRMLRTAEGFRFASTVADDTPIALYSAPGRTEIGGNHTDHQNGKVLCASVDLDMTACAAPNGTQHIHIVSPGYRDVDIELDDLEPKNMERYESAGLVRGIAFKIRELGFEPKGFDANIASEVKSGSGLSSSAAYEVLVGNIMNHICCSDSLTAEQIAKIGQFAENEYFGKPCGLMDQMASSVGGLVFIDFKDPESPVCEKLDCDFSKAGYALCIAETDSGHANLSGEYAQITEEMRKVAECFRKTKLREVEKEYFINSISGLRKRCGDRAVLRALHFFEEEDRVDREKMALEEGDFDSFLKTVTESGCSSAMWLQNTRSEGSIELQEVQVALALAQELLGGRGAVRVHGGGFAGTIQAFVPEDMTREFAEKMELVFGARTCHVLHIRPGGGCMVTEMNEN